MLLMQGAAFLTGTSELTVATAAGGLLGTVLGAALVVGFLTPVAGVAAGLFTAVIALAELTPRPSDENLLPLFVVMVSVAITFLGPGAFSLDSYLFGRREIVIPRELRSHDL
jgi:uncharacterized membrane protein YphA (DoxX/SURF4 family)